MQSRKERDKKKKVFQGERTESGGQIDKNMKRIGFQKGWNSQKKGEVSKKQNNKGNFQ